MNFGRKKPYTASGISRVLCSKIGCYNRGMFQWQCCALDNKWFPLCAEHDIGLNAVAVNFILGHKAKKIMNAYRKRIEA